MRMTTRCPRCGTAYRVRAEQLAARAGHVRCGECATVFDARTTLVAEHESVLPEDQGPPSVAWEPPLPEQPPAEPDAAPQSEAVAVPPPASVPPPEASPAEPESDYEFGPRARQRSRLRTALWALGCVAAAAALAAQLAHAYRTELALALPGARPWLEAACVRLGCTIPLPRRAELISIESTEFYPERGVPGVFTLSAVLRNRAGFAQALPALELTLTDARDQPLARRVLQPADYAPAREAAFAANSERVLKLHIDAAGLEPGGYRLYAFYL